MYGKTKLLYKVNNKELFKTLCFMMLTWCSMMLIFSVIQTTQRHLLNIVLYLFTLLKFDDLASFSCFDCALNVQQRVQLYFNINQWINGYQNVLDVHSTDTARLAYETLCLSKIVWKFVLHLMIHVLLILLIIYQRGKM